MDRQLFTQRRLARWILGILGGMLLLVGLILNASAQAPRGIDRPRLHSIQPVFGTGMQPSGKLHPAVKLDVWKTPPDISNPTAHGDVQGLNCKKCHNSAGGIEQGWKTTLASKDLVWHTKSSFNLECRSCHSQAAAIKGNL